jgi:hypothetical protein
MNIKRLLLMGLGMLLLGSAGLIILHQTIDSPPKIQAQAGAAGQGGPGGPGGFGQPGAPGQPGTPGTYKNLVPPLLEALADADEGVRQLAAATLVKIGADAVPPLVEALKSKDREIRANAAYVLGQLGEQTPETLQALSKTLKDEDKEVRRRVAFAIHNLVARSEAGGAGAAGPGSLVGGGGEGPLSTVPGGRGGGAPPSGTFAPLDPGLLLPQPPSPPTKTQKPE